MEFLLVGGVLLVLLVICTSFLWNKEPSNNDRDGQRIRGKYYVIYDDGERTERMNYSIAKDYAAMFGGTVYLYIDDRNSIG